VDPMFQTSQKLTQEFIRIREVREIDKEAILLALCSRTFKSKVIIFCAQKITAHRLKIIFGLLDLKAAELHGNLSQAQRLESLDKFREEEVDFLIATDIAARGLDVEGIETIVNFNLPPNYATYIHRVGRTARAGKKGVSVSLVSEKERKLLREIVNHSAVGCKNRIIPAKYIDEFRIKIEKLEPDIIEIKEVEKQERLLRMSEMEATKMENMIKYEEEISNRPARIWFMSENQKQSLKEESKRLTIGDEEKKKEIKEKKKERAKERDIPVLERPLSRREKRKKEAERVSKFQYKIEKKSYKNDTLKRKRESTKEKKKVKKRKLNTPNTLEEPAPTTPHLGKKPTRKKFKSQKRYKRRK